MGLSNGNRSKQKAGNQRKMQLPIGGLIVVFIAILSALSLFNLNKALTQEIMYVKDGFDNNIRIAVETLVSSLEVNRQMFLDGDISEETSLEIAKKLVRDTRYSSAPDKTDDGYFFADTAEGFCVVHYNPANEGTMRWDLQDQEGTYLIRNFIMKGNDGGGYTEFYFGKMGDEGGSYLKRGYTLKYEPYGWYITTGNYYEDIDEIVAGIQQIRLQDFIVTIFVSIIISIVGVLLSRERYKMEKKSVHHSELIEITNKVASALLAPAKEDNFEASLVECMKLIGCHMNADRVQIWQNEMVGDILHYTLRYDWVSNNVNNILVPIGTSLGYSSTWRELFLRGGHINGPVSQLEPEDREAMESIGLKSTLTIPLYSRGEFWGIACIDDCERERVFSDDEVNMLTSAGLMLVNSITRHEQSIQLGKMNEQLTDALERATVASKAKGDFLSNMSHEMRTPMNAIIGMTSIGLKANDMEQKNYALNKIEGASIHLLGVINDVLDISKIESGKFELSSSEFSFEIMIIRVINVVSMRVDEKKQELSVYVDRKIPQSMFGDDQHLAQVITNLLGNAIKFTPNEGTIKLQAYFLGEENGVCEIKLAISDSGIGMSPEQQAKLFQSFQQAESSISRKYGGTGLGLAISKNIVEKMGGSIWAESELGKGATFTFTFKMPRGESKTVQTEIDWSKIRILAVDDDPYILQELKGIVEDFGGYCDVAVSGAEAVTLIEQSGDYNFFFLDYRMPEMDGIELAAELRKRTGSNKDVHIVMISAVDFSMISEKAKEAGVDMFLPKPLFPSTVSDTISALLGNTQKEIGNYSDNIEGIYRDRRILLAEDVEINREIVITLLAPTCLVIDCAENGREAVQMFEESHDKYEMIFMDMQMPEMDGLEATRKIRALNAHGAKSVPIIAMTANVFKEDIQNCLEAGMDDHLGKPLIFEEVLGKLRKYMS